ncbi:MAG: hypothetical protein V3U96_02370 [Paracoccaceae bacterium]
MIFVSLASILCVVTAYSLRGNALENGTISVSGFNGISVVAAFVLFLGVAVIAGPEFGIPLIAALLLHELGQVLAYRMLGHNRARFRLLLALSKQKISDEPLTSDTEEFFTSIMGPAFCLGPMALAMAIATMLAPVAPVSAHSFWIFAVTCGAVNFLSLLPFWPLAGARCARAASISFWPALAPAMAAFMSAAMMTASFRTGSVILMVMAAVGAHSMWRQRASGLTPMEPDVGLIALAAYTFTLAAHFSAGWMLFEAYF